MDDKSSRLKPLLQMPHKAEARLAAGFWTSARALDPRLRGGWRTGKGVCAMRKRPSASLDLAFLVDHVLADDGIVLLDLHLGRRVLLVLVGGVEVAGVGRGDQTDLVALACHVVILLRPIRRGRGGRPERSRCRSCRWCATRARKPSA